MEARAGELDQPLPLRHAIRLLTRQDKWDALVNAAGGSDAALDALSRLSQGRVDPARTNEIYDLQKIGAAILADFETRRSNVLTLWGRRDPSRGEAVSISARVSLEYDFAAGSARCGELTYFAVTVGPGAEAGDHMRRRRPRVSAVELETFCRSYVANTSPLPSSEALWRAAIASFPDKLVVRDRVRELYAKLFPPHSRQVWSHK